MSKKTTRSKIEKNAVLAIDLLRAMPLKGLTANYNRSCYRSFEWFISHKNDRSFYRLFVSTCSTCNSLNLLGPLPSTSKQKKGMAGLTFHVVRQSDVQFSRLLTKIKANRNGAIYRWWVRLDLITLFHSKGYRSTMFQRYASSLQKL